MIAKKRLRQLNPDGLTVKEFAGYRARLEETQARRARARCRRPCSATDVTSAMLSLHRKEPTGSRHQQPAPQARRPLSSSRLVCLVCRGMRKP
jgi:L-ribulose-5-phosphate 3-epimerase UlaE